MGLYNCHAGELATMVKRLFDLLIATTLLVVLAPAYLLVSILILLSLGAPVLFKQTRPGLNETPFLLYKFRSMKSGDGDDKDRLTKTGRLIRKLSLDEIPQLLNVIKGDMSLVGPRPLLMQYLPRYNETQRQRHKVRPGITGWAQVRGRNSISWEKKFELDVWYVNNQSFLLDLKILALTFLSVVRRKDVNQSEDVTMTEFMGTKQG